MAKIGCKVCCDSINDLGCYGSCETIVTGLIAPVDGVYLIRYEINDSIRTIGISYDSGDTIIIPASVLNEDYLIVFQVYRPDGTKIGSDCYQALILSEFAATPVPRITPIIPPSEICDNMFTFVTIIGQQAYVIPPLSGGEQLADYSRYIVLFGAFSLPEVDYTQSPDFTNWVIVGNTITFAFPIDQEVEVKINSFV